MRSLVFEGDTWAAYEELRTKDTRIHKALCTILKEMHRGDLHFLYRKSLLTNVCLNYSQVKSAEFLGGVNGVLMISDQDKSYYFYHYPNGDEIVSLISEL